MSGLESPFVDEIVNPGDVVRAASPLQLARQGASTGTIALRKAQIAAEKKKEKEKSDPGTTKKLKTKLTKFEAALKSAQGKK